MFKFIKRLFESDEKTCENCIGVTFGEDDKNPFEDKYREYRALEVKRNYVRYEFRSPSSPGYSDWLESSCECSTFILLLKDCYIVDLGKVGDIKI